MRLRNIFIEKGFNLVFAFLLILLGCSTSPEPVMIEVKGVGAPNPRESEVDKARQSAAVVAFLDGLRNIAKKIYEIKGISFTADDMTGKRTIMTVSEKIGDFGVLSRTVVEKSSGKLIEDSVSVQYKGVPLQTISMKNFFLDIPVDVAEKILPAKLKTFSKISEVEIKELKWSSDGACEIKLVYPFVEDKAKKSEMRDQAVKDLKLNPVYDNGKLCYIDETGKIVLRTDFINCEGWQFHEGLAGVSFYWRPINIQHPEYDKSSPGSKSPGFIKGYIDMMGRLIIPPQFIWAGNFSDGVAWVALHERYYKDPVGEGRYEVTFIDNRGKMMVNPMRLSIFNEFHEGLARVSPISLARIYEVRGKKHHLVPGKIGYMDKGGNFIIPPLFENGQDFSEGVAAVKEESGKWGYINKSGNFVITPQYLHARSFKEGLAAVTMGHRYGFIDLSGKFVINPRFEDCTDFFEGLATVKIDGKWGCIDRGGRIVIELKDYVNVNKFSEGMARIEAGYRKYGFIEKTGKVVIDPEFEFASDFHGGLALVRKNGKIGYINKRGNWVWVLEKK